MTIWVWLMGRAQGRKGYYLNLLAAGMSSNTALPSGIDQKYISNIYENLVSKISVLDGPHGEYKVKQETHFLRTFMNVV